ncbi:MAG: hypothetical protein ACK4UY_15090 [Dietzia sp.]
MVNSRLPALPAEHLDAGRSFSLPSHPPTRLKGNLQAETSPDPYHQIFRELNHPPVVSCVEARTVAERNGLRLPAAYARSARVKPVDVIRSRDRAAVLNLLGVLLSFGAVTNNQAAEFTGHAAFADPRSRIVADMFRSDLLALSPAHLDYGIGSVGHGAAIYKIASRAQVSALHKFLTYAEWLALTGCRPLPTGPVHVRHDVLAAELALRSARLLEVAAVLGPHFCTLADITSASPFGGELRGGPDLTIVRQDGLRIAVELTATIGQRFDKKVERWARVLTENHFDDSGLVVLFLAAPSIEDLRERGDHVRRSILRAVDRAARNHLGSSRSRTAERMGVATWREWFPDSLIATERFSRFSVLRPTGRDPRWETCDLLSMPAPNTSTDLSRARRLVAINATLLAQTPASLRHLERPGDLNTDLLRQAAGPAPTVAPLRDRSSTRLPGMGQGAASDTYLPERLLGTSSEPRTSHQLVTTEARHPRDWERPWFVARRPITRRRKPEDRT